MKMCSYSEEERGDQDDDADNDCIYTMLHDNDYV